MTILIEQPDPGQANHAGVTGQDNRARGQPAQL
jgi:hypothetical protein